MTHSNVVRAFLITLFSILFSQAFGQAPNISYQTPQVYTVNTTITSLLPTNSGGAVPAQAYGMVTTFAGSGTQGATDGTALTCSFNNPTDIAFDASGNSYVADQGNNIIRKITPNGQVTTFAGSSLHGSADGQGTSASFNIPERLIVDNHGNIYVADVVSNSIRLITPSGYVSTLSQQCALPKGIALDANNNLFIANSYTNCIKELTQTRQMVTIAGTGAVGLNNGPENSATFHSPTGVAIDANGNIFIADTYNNIIRKITTAGIVSTFAGTGSMGLQDGIASAASFSLPTDIVIDYTGNLYISDNGNSLIRKITPSGVVSTIAGKGKGYANGIGESAKFQGPVGICLTNDNNIYVADESNNVIRKVSLNGYTIDKALPAGLTFDPTTGKISGTPLSASSATDYTVTAYNMYGSSSAVINIEVKGTTPIIYNTVPPNISYQTPQVYVLNNTISPLTPTNTGGAVPANYGQVTTVAGSGAMGTADLKGAAATFNKPIGLRMDLSGNLFVADNGNNKIRKIDPTGMVSTFAGSGLNSTVDGVGSLASFGGPTGIAIDNSGNLFVTDENSNYIRKIDPSGNVSKFAGDGSTNDSDGTGSTASFFNPWGVFTASSGDIFVTELNGARIRKISPSGVVSTYLGGTGYSLGAASGIFIDKSNTLYVACQVAQVVKSSVPGSAFIIGGTSIAGYNDGPATTSQFNAPADVAVDPFGNAYVADTKNNLIRKITTGGIVSTLAGNTAPGFTDGSAANSRFDNPMGIAIDGGGNLYVSDTHNNAIRKISISGYTIDKPLPTGLVFDPTTGIISGTPTVLSPATDYTVTAVNAGGVSSTVVNIEVIQQKPSIITFPPIVNPVADVNNNFDPAAKSTNTETPIVYTSSNPAVATITPDGLVHLVGPGVSIITATQVGDANYTAAIPVTETLTVMEDQELDFPLLEAKTLCDADFNVDVTSTNNTIPITYTSSNTAVATISAEGLVHIVGTGSTVITASQAGNNLYIAANPQSQTLTVNPTATPVVHIVADHNNTCTGTPIIFTATVSNGGASPSYQWQVNGVNAGSNNSQFTITNTLRPTDVVQCIVSNYTCSVSGTSNALSNLSISPYITPSVSISTPTSFPACSGADITFTAHPTNGGANPSYQWQVNGVNAGTNSASFGSSNLANSDKVSCILTNTDNACFTGNNYAVSNSINVSIKASVTPQIAITASANNVYGGTSVTFTANVINGPATHYQWQINGNNTGSNTSPFTTDALYNGDKVTCTIEVNDPCVLPIISNVLVMNILAPPVISNIPNTFTPNGDGVNDTWHIPDLTFYPNCLVSIYNRYGQLVYQSKGYSKNWDGTLNGQNLPVATYYYIIDLGGNNSNKVSGYVTIMR